MKKGITLIELIAVLAIMSIIFSISYMPIKAFNHIENNIEFEYVNDSIFSFLNISKIKCKEKRKVGIIYFDLAKNSIYFFLDNRKISFYQFPKGYTITNLNLEGLKMNIDIRGQSFNGGTLIYKDREKGLHTITFHVGQDYVDIK